jgi:nitrate reductase alpha subunit
VKLADGSEVEVATAWNLYQVHLKDYDLDSVSEITSAPKELIQQLAKDIATIKPCSIHQGEGINHWFHATEANRAAYLPVMLTGNIGKPGAGCHGWAGNYKAALFQGSKLTGPGFKGWIGEDPFEQNLDPKAHGSVIHAHALHEGRGAGLLEPRRPAADREHAQGRTQSVHLASRTCPRRRRRFSRRT